jgi:hypothetical protein
MTITLERREYIFPLFLSCFSPAVLQNPNFPVVVLGSAKQRCAFAQDGSPHGSRELRRQEECSLAKQVHPSVALIGFLGDRCFFFIFSREFHW